MFHPTNIIRLLLVLSLLAIWSCSANRSTQSNVNNSPATTSRVTETPKPGTETPKPPPAEAGALKVGEASGSYTADGETVTLKYAYAGRSQSFGHESVVILLTDKEIPAEALAEEIKDQRMLLDGKIRGLEYAIMKDAYWVRYHPGQYQESKTPSLKDYVVENDVVKGSDEDKGNLTDGKYARSVKFVAAISK
ncbi:MAG: hypothetical protein ACXW3C_11085 [Pyrinomonadaceae bacterium]